MELDHDATPCSSDPATGQPCGGPDFVRYEQRLTALEAKLDANSAATERVLSSTRDIVEIMESWKVAMKTIGMVGAVLRPLTWILAFCSALVGLWATIRHGFGGDK